MLGFRDLVLITPNPSMHQQNQPIPSDHHPNLSLPSSAALGVGVGIFPLLTATPRIAPPNNGVQDDGGNLNINTSCWSLKKCQDLTTSAKKDGHGHGLNNESDGSDHQQMLLESGGSGSMTACRDCGNRAKKDCNYRRCRTCCKSRAYDCSTHVRSTWMPASRRRERKMVVVCGGIGGGGGSGSSGSSSGVKRPRSMVSPQTQNGTNTSNSTTPRSFETTSSHQDASFKQSLPGQVCAPAVFKCRRVTAVSNGEAEFVYQATVNISGHVFKGVLYDQGVDDKNALENSSSGRNRDSFPTPIVAPSNAYPPSTSSTLLNG